VFAFSESRGPVDVAFTDRAGGVSGEPFASLNLAATGHDAVAAVTENLRRVVGAFTGSPDAPVAAMHQVHGARVAVVGRDVAPTEPRGGLDGLPEADALVAAVPGVTLLVRVADCVPVLLADPGRGVVGAVHAGRPGLVAGIVPAALDVLREHGAERVVAWVGPHVCGRCYEVPAPMRAEVAAVVPEAWAETSWGTPAVDVGAGVLAQLRQEGVEVVSAERCTLEDPALYSYRRDRERSGRMAGLVRVRP
jgi:polyphenol oxidase